MGAMKDVAIRASDIALDVAAGQTVWGSRRNLDFKRVEYAYCTTREAAERVEAWAERAYPPAGYGTTVVITEDAETDGFNVRITRYNSCD